MVDEFLIFEDKNKLFEREIRGFFYWPYIRYEVFSFTFHNEVSNNKSNHFIGIFDYLTVLKYAILKNTIFFNNHVDILAMSFPRRIMQDDGHYVDPYISPIVRNTNHSTLCLERYSRKFQNVDNDEYKTLYLEDSELLSILYRKMISSHVKKNLVQESRRISELVKSFFSVEISEKSIYDKLLISYSMWKAYRIKFRSILRKTSPYCIVEVPGYADHNQVLNEVAKEFDIPTIEIEHGFAREVHVPWNFLKKQTISSSPDFFFCGSQYTKDNVRFSIPDDHVVVVGNNYLSQRVSNRRKATNTNEILILGGIYYSDELSSFAVHLVSYLRRMGMESFHITYKCHPKDPLTAESYTILKRDFPEVDIIVGTQGKSVYDCLESAGKVVGIYTSTMFEAIAYGAEVYALKTEGSKDLENFVLQGYMAFIKEPEDMFMSRNAGSKCLWAEDSVTKTMTALEQIIQEKKRRKVLKK